MIGLEALQQTVWQGIRKEVHADKIQLYLPFFFGAEANEPLCLTWTQDGVLSDGGRTLAELKKRTGDLAPHMEKIRRILNPFNPVELVAGHQLVVRQFQTVCAPDETYTDYGAAVSHLIRTMSLISIVDTVQVSDSGEVSL